MGGLVLFLAVFMGLTFLGLLAQLYGVDSRPEFDDPRAPAKGLSV